MRATVMVGAAVLATAGAVLAQTSAPRWVERTKADVRAGRGSVHAVVDTVVKGESVEVLRTEQRWLSVRTPRAKIGWIFEAALSSQPVGRSASDFLRLAPGDASTSATAASAGAKGIYAQDYARSRGFDYGVVQWIESNQGVTAPDLDTFVRQGELRGPGGER
jgi:uncharacterized protein YgiM (DUF1202 family)